MKRILLFAFLLLACNFAAGIAGAQTLSGTARVKWVSALPATCITTRRDRVLVYKYTATSGLYYCSAANTWELLDGNASPTFTGTVTAGGLAATSPTVGVGYATGAGGAQTQATNKATTVVSNTITTAVTMNNAALAAATIVAFTFTNSAIAATDTVLCTHESAGTSAAYTCNAFPGAGSAVVSVRNNTAGSLSEAIVLRITVIKSVSS